MKFINKLHKSFVSRGLYGTFLWFISGYFAINKFIVFYRNLEIPFESPKLDSSIKISQISLDTLRMIRRQVKGLPVEFYCDKTNHFTVPYVAEVNGEIAAINWLVKPGENSRFLVLGEQDLELNFNTVLPKFRGKRLAELVMAEIIASCISVDSKRIFCVVHVSNIPQYKQLMRLGFEPVEILTHFNLYRPKATLRYLSPGR